jgi:hypothetical protein
MIQEALNLPMHEREQLAAAAGFILLSKILMEDGNVFQGAQAAADLLDEQMRVMLQRGWTYKPE